MSTASRVLAKSIGYPITVVDAPANPPDSIFPIRYFFGSKLGSAVLNCLSKSFIDRFNAYTGK